MCAFKWNCLCNNTCRWTSLWEVLSRAFIYTDPCRPVNTLRERQNGRHVADDIFKYIFLNENDWIPIKISLKFVPKGRIDIIPALVQIMAWCRPSDKPSSEPMMICLPTHICVTWPQWVKLHIKAMRFINRVPLAVVNMISIFP